MVVQWRKSGGPQATVRSSVMESLLPLPRFADTCLWGCHSHLACRCRESVFSLVTIYELIACRPFNLGPSGLDHSCLTTPKFFPNCTRALLKVMRTRYMLLRHALESARHPLDSLLHSGLLVRLLLCVFQDD